MLLNGDCGCGVDDIPVLRFLMALEGSRNIVNRQSCFCGTERQRKGRAIYEGSCSCGR